MEKKKITDFAAELEQLIQKQKKQNNVLQQNNLTEIIAQKLNNLEAIDITIRFFQDK